MHIRVQIYTSICMYNVYVCMRVCSHVVYVCVCVCVCVCVREYLLLLLILESGLI